MSPEAILADLVAFPSICRTPNGDIVAFIRNHLAQLGVECTILPGPEGDRYNLFASIGPAHVPGYILSAHLDVVPAPSAGWTSDPFRLRQEGSRLFGRGAVDMKGFVACVLAVVPDFLAHPLQTPVHIALSYDEEVGCRGVRHLLPHLATLPALPIGCIVGEPTGLRPVLRHKGKISQRVTVHGRAGHSSRPDLADNAIHAAIELMAAVRDQATIMSENGHRDERFEPPFSTLQVGTVQGGIAVNVVPDHCTFDLEARAVPGVSPREIVHPLEVKAAQIARDAKDRGRSLFVETEALSEYPALDLPDDHPLATLVEDLAGRPRLAAVSFGTEAGLFQEAGVPSIVCGPGDVTRAHQPDEYIETGELADGLAMLRRLGQFLRG